MSDEPFLPAKTRHAIEGRPLPDRLPDRMWGGRGAGASCAICRAPVTPEEVEYEMEFVRNGDPILDTYHVHVGCLGTWMSNRTNGAKPSGA
jgi:hypothetical protein